MRAVVLALLLLPACLEARAQDLGGEGLMRGGMSGKGSMQMPGGLRDFVELFSVNYTTPTHVPTCSVATACAFQCTVDSGGLWVCVEGDGDPITETQGAGVTSALSPWGYALTDVTHAQAPRLAAAVANNYTSVLASPHTLVVAGFSSSRTSSVAQYALEWSTGNDGLEVRGDGAGWRCTWRLNGSGQSSVLHGTQGPRNNGLTVDWCAKEATGASSVYHAITVGGETTDTTWDFDPGQPTGSTMYFGTRAAADLPWRGPLVSVTLYSEYKDATARAEIEKQIAGVPTEHVDAAPNDSQKAYTVVSGKAWPVTLSRVDATGLYIEENNGASVGGSGGNWAADAIDADSWTDVGTPTITVNQASGPFSIYAGAAEADLIEDNDAGAFEGLAATLDCADNVLGKVTVSCYVRTGTAGTTTDQVRLSVVSDGTGSADCDFTDLTSTFVRKECTATITGTPTDTRGRVLVGDNVADTGSIIVSQCQCDRQGWATSPKPDNASVGLDLPLISETETQTWPQGDNTGEIEIVFSVDANLPTDDYDNDDTWFLVDLPNDVPDEHAVFWLYKATTNTFWFRTGGSGAVETVSSTVTMNAGQNYVARMRWVPHGTGFVDHFMYFDECAAVATCTATTLIGSDTTGTQMAQSETYGDDRPGRRWDDTTFGMHGHIARYTVRQAP